MRYMNWVLACLLAIAGVSMASGRACSQTEPVPADQQALFDDIADIDKLRVLGPVKLTAEQLDKLIPVIKDAQAAYSKKVGDAAAGPLKAIAREIKAVRAKVLAGSEIPKDFDDQVKRLQADFVKRQAREDERALTTVLDAFSGLLTKTQRSTVISLTKSIAAKDATEDEKIRAYVVGTFMQYGRIVPLLEDMRKAIGAVKETTP